MLYVHKMHSHTFSFPNNEDKNAVPILYELSFETPYFRFAFIISQCDDDLESFYFLIDVDRPNISVIIL